MRILLADDSTDHQMVIRSHMRGTSHHMEVVEDGVMAVEVFKARRFDLVLIHARIPLLDGIGAVRAMRAWEAQMGQAPIPIVAMLRRESGDAEAALRVGSSAHVARPVELRELFECLSNLRWPDPAVVWSGKGGEDRTKRIVVKVDPDLKPLIPGFLEKRRQDLTELKTALKAYDLERIRLVGHRLKGKGSGYGFAGISKVGDMLEHSARARDLFGIREGIEELDSYLGRLELVD